MKIKAIIVDDEFANRDLLRLLVDEHCNSIEICDLAASVEEAVTCIDRHLPDLVFLDVEMPGEDGFALFKRFPRPGFDVVFVTAYEHYAIQAIRNNALDFILKPIDEQELKAMESRLLERRNQEVDESAETASGDRGNTDGSDASTAAEINRNSGMPAQNTSVRPVASSIERLMRELSQSRPVATRKVYVPTTGGFKIVDSDDIEYLQADGNYTTMFMADGSKQVITRSIGEFEEQLGNGTFFRCHKSYLVNINHIDGFSQNDGGMCVTRTGTHLPVSRRKQTEFMQMIYNITGLNSRRDNQVF
jgi:two-component system LytT family response regulator